MHPEINKICKHGLLLFRSATISNLEPGGLEKHLGAAGKNPKLMQQVRLIRLYPEVSGSGASCERALRRSLSKEAVIKERSIDKRNSSNKGFMPWLTPCNTGSLFVWQKRIYLFLSPARRQSII